jgi:FkbM family methyltransferase
VSLGHPLLERFPQLRRVTDTRPVQRAAMTGRLLGLMAEPGAFLRGEVRGGTGAYRLAGAGDLRVVLRHRSPDLQVLNEIRRLRHYEPPPGPAEALARRLGRNGTLRVLDLGGNVGLFAVDALSRYPSARVVSYEADPGNFRVLAACRAANPAADWEVHEGFAGAADGVVRFAAGNFAHSHADDGGVEVTRVDILPRLAGFDYVKVDIEGGEWPIITDERWPEAIAPAAAMVMEWHERMGPASGARQAAVAAVRRAGFEASDDGPGFDHGLIWAWRPPGDAG